MPMTSSAEELHHKRLNLEPAAGAEPRLFIDLDICTGERCRQCEVQCSYFYHPGNNGVLSLAELASYVLVCRHCEEPHCVSSCPVEALEKQPQRDGTLVRHTMRCVGCRSCSHACPYGTIYPELVPLGIHNCDYCADRRGEAGEPLCVRTCPYDALALRTVEDELEENTFLVGDNLVVHSTHWNREKA
jgi:Fe-S-cluster-containing dehydrogenase component